MTGYEWLIVACSGIFGLFLFWNLMLLLDFWLRSKDGEALTEELVKP